MALSMPLVLQHSRWELHAGFWLSILDVYCTTYSDNRFGNILKLLPSLHKERAWQRSKRGGSIIRFSGLIYSRFWNRKGCVTNVKKGQARVFRSTTIYFHLANTRDCIAVRHIGGHCSEPTPQLIIHLSRFPFLSPPDTSAALDCLWDVALIVACEYFGY